MRRSRFWGIGVWLVAIVVLGLVIAGGLFLADPGAAEPEPVVYDDTVQLGPSLEGPILRDEEATLPTAQVFYSQFQYVVGYNGIETLLADLRSNHRADQLGYPLAIYVSDFGPADPYVTEDGYLASNQQPRWVPAGDARYVVGEGMQTPAGETIVPFASETAATSFAADHGGTVYGWDGLLRAAEAGTIPTGGPSVEARYRAVDGPTVSPDSVEADGAVLTVGEDVPNLELAVETAPPDATVRLPAGEYAGPIAIDRPVSLVGTDAKIIGNNTGSVVTVTADNVSIEGVHIAGTGNETQRADDEDSLDLDDVDSVIEHGYGHADAAIEGDGAANLTVANVTVDTNASGIVVRDGPGLAVRSIDIHGKEDWRDGFMGIVAMRAPATITDSRFLGGRDGVYVHQAPGSIIRNNSFSDNRYGIHLMYSDDVVMADNRIRNASFGGITVMTRPSGTTVVANDIRSSANGIQMSGNGAYVGCNVLVDNGLGIGTGARQSVYTENVFVGNDDGARATTVIPSSQVFANDFVGNDRHAAAGAGPLRVWTTEGVGNHWDGAYGPVESGVYQRPYSPTDPVQGQVHHDASTLVLDTGPVAWGVDRLAGSIPGMRSGSIIDTAPRADPTHPTAVKQLLEDETAQVDLECSTEAGFEDPGTEFAETVEPTVETNEWHAEYP